MNNEKTIIEKELFMDYIIDEDYNNILQISIKEIRLIETYSCDYIFAYTHNNQKYELIDSDEEILDKLDKYKVNYKVKYYNFTTNEEVFEITTNPTNFETRIYINN